MSKLACRISVFALAAAGAFAQTNVAPAAVTRTTGMIGIAQGDTARFNVLNPGVLPPAIGVACTAVLTYYGPEGGVLKTASVPVSPGQAGYLDLFSSSDLNLMIGERKQIRATFTVPAVVPQSSTGSTSSSEPAAICPLIGTLEILNTNTGQTTAVLGGTHAVPVGPVPASSN